ncbi:RHS repeat protein, partial [Pseudoalteromonas sp. PPB1]|uniref:RHS repeat protein n=1 Tax=Pseudoalteromonas sp. PPB1 TaxID=2756136 RepID=UPI001890D297
TMSTASVNTSIWRLKSDMTSSYGRKQETSFVTANSTKPYLVYPSRTITKTYNTDVSSLTLISTKTKTVSSVDSFGNPVKHSSVIDTKNGYAKTDTTNTYGYSYHGGRVTKTVETKRYLNRLNGTNKGNYQNTHTSTFAYDSKGRLIKTTADNGVAKSYTLNSYGLITKETVSKSGLPTKTLETYYDSTYRLVTGEKNSLGHRSTIGYDSLGRKSYTQTANGQRTYYTYNKLGRLTGEVSTPADNTSKTGTKALSTSQSKYWCTSGCISGAAYYEESVSESDPTSRTYYDKYGRVLRESTLSRSGTYTHVDSIYDTKGRKYKESMPYFHGGTTLWNVYKYDKQNRVVQVTKADGSIWKTEYNGESVTTVNPSNHKHTQLKNMMGLLVKVTDANSKSAYYEYDEKGKTRLLTGPKGNKIQVSYDKYGNKTRVIDPDKGTVNYSYNAYHQLTRESDSNGNVITYQYDVLGRSKEVQRKRGSKLEHHAVNTYDSGAYAKGMIAVTTD